MPTHAPADVQPLRTSEPSTAVSKGPAKVIDAANSADHQLLSLDLTLVTAEGDQGQMEVKARALGAQVAVEDDDF